MDDELKNQDENQVEAPEAQSEAREVAFSEIEPGVQENGNGQNLDFLLDIPLEITVELGKTQINIGNLLKLSQGSVVELDKLTDQPLEIFVNRKLMAEGEVVVVNEKFGIRLTDIVSPIERVKSLG